MHRHEPLHEGETDAESRRRSIKRPLRSRKQIEDGRQHLARDADAVVGDANDDVIAVTLETKHDRSADVGEFRRVVENVRDDLRESRRIAVDLQR